MVRRLIGYGRYETEAALTQLNVVYALLRIWINQLQPAMKLVGKERDGANVTNRYDVAQTPYRRVLTANVLSEEAQVRIDQEHGSRGPVALRRDLEGACETLWRLREGATTPGPAPQGAGPGKRQKELLAAGAR